MWTIVKELFTDPEKFKRFIRAAVLGVGGGGGIVLANELKEIGVDPGVVRWVRITSAAFLFLGGLIGIGDKTPPEVKVLAARVANDDSGPRGFALGATLRYFLLGAVAAAVLSCAAWNAARNAARANLKESVNFCAQQTLDDFKAQNWRDISDAALAEIDAALRKDWTTAVGVLTSYVKRYGREFVDCTVAKFRTHYAAEAPAPGSGGGSAGRGLEDAEAWLARDR